MQPVALVVSQLILEIDPVCEDRAIKLRVRKDRLLRIPLNSDAVSTAQIAVREIETAQVTIAEIHIPQIRAPEMLGGVQSSVANHFREVRGFAAEHYADSRFRLVGQSMIEKKLSLMLGLRNAQR